MDKAFGRVDGDLREIRVEMRKGFEQIDQCFEQMEKRFDKVDERFDKVDKRFDQIITWLVSLSCTIIGSLVAGVIASQALG